VSLQRKSGNASRSIIRIRRITTNCTLRCRSDRRSRSLTGRQPKRRAPARSRTRRRCGRLNPVAGVCLLFPKNWILGRGPGSRVLARPCWIL
jgi:hypothetical protein